MNGKQQVAAHRARVEAVFARAKRIEEDGDAEIRSDLARYLCVIVSGYLEKSVSEMLIQHARRSGSPPLQRFVERSVGKFTNANCGKLMSLFSTFDPRWGSRLQAVLVDDVKEAVDSVVANRHLVAHGENVGITYARMWEYYQRITQVVEVIILMCDPV
jgi:hypothetical protein